MHTPRFAALALLCVMNAAASADPFPMPPPGYEFKGQAIITYVPSYPIACPLAFGAAAGSCAQIGANPCLVYLPQPSLVSAKFFAMLKKHELAHCAGWGPNHPGAIYVETR
jgi:hypothetical protein